MQILRKELKMALKPRITQSPQVRLIDLKSKPFFIVASVEVGNTTTKSILTATNMDTGRTHIINKVVRMTRDVRPPSPGFGIKHRKGLGFGFGIVSTRYVVTVNRFRFDRTLR